MLVSYPKTNGLPSARSTAAKAAKASLRRVGVLDSSRFASLQPGYYVVFTGIFPTRADADRCRAPGGLQRRLLPSDRPLRISAHAGGNEKL